MTDLFAADPLYWSLLLLVCSPALAALAVLLLCLAVFLGGIVFGLIATAVYGVFAVALLAIQWVIEKF